MFFSAPPNRCGVFCVKGDTRSLLLLLDNNGAVVVEYKYDAWGKCKVLDANGSEISNTAHIGILNPFRYRGYYFDIETGFYFLKTRYYDPIAWAYDIYQYIKLLFKKWGFL